MGSNTFRRDNCVETRTVEGKSVKFENFNQDKKSKFVIALNVKHVLFYLSPDSSVLTVQPRVANIPTKANSDAIRCILLHKYFSCFAMVRKPNCD